MQNAFGNGPVQFGLSRPEGGNGRFLVAARDRRLDFFDRGANPTDPGAVYAGPLYRLPNAFFCRFVLCHRNFFVIAGRAYIRPSPRPSIRLDRRGDPPPGRPPSLAVIEPHRGTSLPLAADAPGAESRKRSNSPAVTRYSWRQAASPSAPTAKPCWSSSRDYRIKAGKEMEDADRGSGLGPPEYKGLRSLHSGGR